MGRLKYGLFVIILGSYFFWDQRPRVILEELKSGGELLSVVEQFRVAQESLPVKTGNGLIDLGQALFSDPGFSLTGQISCATCHDPKKAFTDGKALAQGLGQTSRRTPSLLNVFAQNWFFWDGRADSLASQALGPLEHPKEQGVSRLFVARRVGTHYLKEYETFFGPFPMALLSPDLPAHATPKRPFALLPQKTLAYSLSSLGSLGLLDDLIVSGQKNNRRPIYELAQRTWIVPDFPLEWTDNWERHLSDAEKEATNRVFFALGQAIAAFEKTLVAVHSPFDQFLERFSKTKNEDASLQPGFGQKELLGLKIFTGPAQCTNCHHGPFFSDQEFHNIGLPPIGSPDLGRSLGILLAQTDPFGRSPEATEDSRYTLDSLNLENLEFVGAFKTPSLRNVGLRAPYMHDGRFANLEQVLDHYMGTFPPALGHREESILSLNLRTEEKEALIRFLESLSSAVTE
jgi:cytochrome c peroxidase